ncbi:MAG TPA: hypothetical protein PK636_10270 [bacterium]|nr:hypothetical protein [bacterium]HPJ73061.1 hypothetical protein [bacterium]HPQ66683.1 hypothetical protein [bacterium]
MSRTAALICILGLAAAASAPAQPYFQPQEGGQEFNGDVTALFPSQYIWRGLEYNPDFVFQPSIRLNESGVEIGADGTLDMTNVDGLKGDFSQWRFRGGLARRTAEGGVSLMYVYYYYPEHNRHKTQELALEMSWGRPLFIEFDIYWDFDYAEGFYGKADLGYFLDMSPFFLTPRVGIGGADGKWNEAYYGVDKTAFCDFLTSLELGIDLGEGLLVTGSVSYYQIASSDLREAVRPLQRGDYWWYTLGAAWNF